jgi:hypothetical protein
MLRGNYNLVQSVRTEPAQLIQTMASDPLGFHLYKRNDFNSKYTELLNTQLKKISDRSFII